MAPFAAVLVLLLGMAARSDATYCVCNNGVADQMLQKNIDYACGNGADCTAIQSNGPCFNPNTVKDHCNYAVNSFYQRKGQGPGTCDFVGTATVVPNPPSAPSGCVFQSSPSAGGGTTTPTISPPGTPTPPSTGGTPTTPASPTFGGTPTPPTTVGGGVTNPGGVPGSSTNPGIGISPMGNGGFGTTDPNGKAPPRGSGLVLTLTVIAGATALLICDLNLLDSVRKD